MTETKDSFKLIGLKVDGQTSNEDGQSSKDCGELWQKFEADKVFDRIPAKLSDEVYAVYFDYNKKKLAFSYFIGCRVDSGTKAFFDLEELLVPAQTYQQFLAKGVMPDCITEAWKAIWDTDMAREFGYDLEIYSKKSRDWSDAEVDIFISMEGVHAKNAELNLKGH